MSNYINLIRTKFTDYSGPSYGYRAYDGYEKVYSNTFESPASEDDKQFFLEVVEDGEAENIIAVCHDNQVGLHIDGTFYEFEEIVKWMTEK